MSARRKAGIILEGSGRRSAVRKDVKEAVIFAGNYGSGKTELALNTALEFAQRGRTVLCDMDIVNPYFRSAEHREMLENAGVHLIIPPSANTMVDLPALSPEVMSAFEYDYAVFDAGGDSVGATALGAYRQAFEALRPDLRFCLVVNARRPLQQTAPQIIELMRQIESNARLSVDEVINNTNLSRETTPEDLEYGHAVCAEVSEETGIPLAYTAGTGSVIESYLEEGGQGEVRRLEIYTRPEWLDTTADEP